MAEHTKKQKDGGYGEDLAAAHLALHGYVCVARSFRSRFGEIDIIAQKGQTLIFAEVKTRTAGGLGIPGEAVNRAKRTKIAATAAQYLAENPGAFYPRFDVIEVLTAKEAEPEMNHIPNAFDSEGFFGF